MNSERRHELQQNDLALYLARVAVLGHQRRGGEGAVREACEFILQARNAWEDAMADYR